MCDACQQPVPDDEEHESEVETIVDDNDDNDDVDSDAETAVDDWICCSCK